MAQRFHQFHDMDDNDVQWVEESGERARGAFESAPLFVFLLFFIAAIVALRFLFKYVYHIILSDEDDVPSPTSMYSITSSLDKSELAGYSNIGYQHAERIIP